MKRLWTRLRPNLPRIGMVALILALIVVGANGYRIAASKPDNDDLAAEYEEGRDEGYSEGFFDGEEKAEADLRHRLTQLKRQKGNAYWTGWEEGEEGAWDEAQRLLDEEEIPFVFEPEGASTAEPEYGGQYEPDYGGQYEPPSYDAPDYGPPTTEDFGSGRGSIVQCKDGTWSDSGGIQGACSHHGGVR